eukprot:Plantae.Rhodophyta-Purpureofilum_apyrenoidigerum.ctg11313.p1 GENE.Plantae.Rhodophyta-Purpureofilum_apyrenoidigerum.ctg11313~~Plantae.Rhodophyta-Purpureofilum_apyrenoidigerum.ctg11313.p1  ORF type:complete len:301 (-),score=50.80 Plantae.Rhodophyta-Purpureofilum_apyrenoidigerum.ctg11313:71-952(-)
MSFTRQFVNATDAVSTGYVGEDSVWRWGLDFSWEGSPLSGVQYPIIGVMLYLPLIFALERFMRNRPPMKLQKITATHNILLCTLSLAMCVGTCYELVQLAKRSGFFTVVCDREHQAMHGRLAVWMYVFYLSKYYELFDTVIMVLKKRKLNFLHIYHHCVVMPLFWGYMQSSMVIHWILVVANSLVHVFMYYYYAIATFGKTVWWKKYLTLAQIVQFVIDLTATWPFPFLYFSSEGCSGSMRGWLFGQAVGASFFKLFSDFYKRSYTRKADVKAGIDTVADKLSPSSPEKRKAN